MHEKTKKHEINYRPCDYQGYAGTINDMYRTYKYNNIRVKDLKLFENNMIGIISDAITEQDWKTLKMSLCLHAEFYKPFPGKKRTKIIDNWFNSGTITPITDASLIPEVLSRMISKICDKIAKFTREGSGWIIRKLLNFEIKLSRYRPIAASSNILVKFT